MEQSSLKYHSIFINPSNPIQHYINLVMYGSITDDPICLVFPNKNQYQQQMSILSELCNYLKEISCLKVEMLEQNPSIEEQAILFQNLIKFTNLKSFSLEISKCKQTINFAYLPQQPMSQIKQLSINIQNCQYNDSTITNLSNYISGIQNLENLELSMTETEVLNQNSQEQFLLSLTKHNKLERLQFNINSSKTLHMQNVFIESLRIFQNLKSLHLQLNFKKNVGEDKYEDLFTYLSKMIFMEQLKLNFQYLGEENKFDHFGYSLQKMKELKNLNLKISQQVSRICLDCIGEALIQLKNVKKLKLSVLTDYSYAQSFYNGINSLSNLEKCNLQIKRRSFQKQNIQQKSYLSQEVECIKNLSNLKNFQFLLNSITVQQIIVGNQLVDIFRSACNLSHIELEFNYSIGDEIDIIAQALSSLQRLKNFKINFTLQANINGDKLEYFLEIMGQIKSLEVLDLQIFKIKNHHLLFFSKGFKHLCNIKEFVFFLQTSCEDSYTQDLFREIRHLVNLQKLTLNIMPDSFSIESSKILEESLQQLNKLKQLILGIVIAGIIPFESIKNIKSGLQKHKQLNILSAFLIDKFQGDQEEEEDNLLKQKRANQFKKYLIRLVKYSFS